MEPIAVRDLTDTDNPFYGQYAEWDLWIIAHEFSILQSQGVTNIWDQPGQMYGLSVTGEGYLIPYVENTRRYFDSLRNGDLETLDDCQHSINAYGVMPPELEERMHAQVMRLSAESFPEVPEWLPGLNPDQAMIHPDGRVVVSIGQRYRLYSPEGTELAQTELGEPWLSLVVPDWDGLSSKLDKFDYTFEMYCYIACLDDNFDITTLYDMDGSKVPGAEPYPDRDYTHYAWMEGEDLAEIRRYQQQEFGTAG